MKTTNGHKSEPFEEFAHKSGAFFDDILSAVKKKTATLKEKKLDELSDDVKAYVRKHPFQSVLMAAGAGFILAWLLKRRK